MEKFLEEKFLNLKEKDLIIEYYNIESRYVEAKLNCGLYIYFIGFAYDPEESYGKSSEFLFSGSITNYLIKNKFYGDFLCKHQNNLFEILNLINRPYLFDKTDPKCKQVIKIAKNVIEKSECTIHFFELDEYITNLKEKYKIEFQNRMKPYQDKIDAILERVKKSKQTPTLSNNIDDSQKK